MTNTETVIGSGLKIVVSREELAQKLAVVGRGVSTRTAVQILSGVLLRAAGGKLELAATDMELSIRTTLDAQVDGDGAVVVPGRLLVDLSRLLPDSEVTIEFREEENILRVSCGPAEYRLNTYGAEDFPRLPEVDASPTSTVSADALLDTLSAVGRAVSRDEARPVLTGHPRQVRRGQAGHGGDRLVPALVQGDAGRGRGAGPGGDRPCARARRGTPPRDRRRHTRARRPGEPGALRGRRNVADDRAASRASSRRSTSCGRRSSRTRSRSRARSCSTSFAAPR